MSNGYLVAAEADVSIAHEIGEGFGLDVIDAASVHDVESVAAALARASNVGILVSAAAAADERFMSFVRGLAERLQNVQLIQVGDAPPTAFSFLPTQWPAMTLEDARHRIDRRRELEHAERAHPLPPSHHEDAPATQQAEPEPAQEAEQAEPPAQPGPLDESGGDANADTPADAAPPMSEHRDDTLEGGLADERQDIETDAETRSLDDGAQDRARESDADSFSGGAREEAAAEPPAPPAAEPEPPPAPMPAPSAPPQARSEAPAPAAKRSTAPSAGRGAPGSAPISAPADATAFAPKKLRRGTPELVRIVIHQPKQLRDVIKAARKIDPRAEPAPQGMSVGDVALGSEIGVALEARGAACDGTLQRRTWEGEPIDFSFTAEVEEGVKQAVFLARVFVGDAQIGVLAFTRGTTGPKKKPVSAGDVRMKRHKRVFLSYSSKDREIVSVIATAYERAGVEHFWDRTSLKSGEEWSPRLRREIEKADLFHLCWSKAASQSEWVEKETEHALERRKRSNGKKPEITVQMLDGPPWAPHPQHLDAINFDDFVRAAIVGYARGDGS